MLYFTKMTPIPYNDQALKFISDPKAVHGWLWCQKEKEEEDKRILWRVDRDRRGQPFLFVQTNFEPDFNKLEGSPQSQHFQTPLQKVFEPNFHRGQVFQFRLRANPIRTTRDVPKGKAKRKALVLEDDLQLWLERKIAESGARCRLSNLYKEGPVVIHRDKKKGSMTFNAVLFEGGLEVENPEAFNKAFATGIGPAKGYGFGMLTLARC